jgi:hypothetical protein
MDRKRLNICRKKQWHKFKVQGVKRKRRASLGLTTGVGSIYSVPSPSMGRRNVTSNSLGKTKTDSWSHCGEKRTWERFYHGRILWIKRKGYHCHKQGRPNAAKEGHDDEELENDQEVEQTHTSRSSLDEGGLILSSFMCWNSSVHRINDEITERRGNLEQLLNTTSSSEVSRKLQKTRKGENGGWKIRLIIFVGGTSGSMHAQTLNDNLNRLPIYLLHKLGYPDNVYSEQFFNKCWKLTIFRIAYPKLSTRISPARENITILA